MINYDKAKISSPIEPKPPINLPLGNSLYFGKVQSIDDDKNSGRIKVFIDGIDKPMKETDTLIKNLPLCYPLLSRIVHVMPKVGEMVLVLMTNLNKNSNSTKLGNRYWIGPMVINYSDIKENNFVYGDNITADPWQSLNLDNRKIEEDIFPIDSMFAKTNENDVSLIGRNNTDITQSDDKITLRAGKHKKNNPKQKNEQNPVYSILEFIDENTSYSLTAGDELYLVSHKGKNKYKKVLTKNDIAQLKSTAQSMLYGELTVKYLRTLTEAFLTHIHTHPQKEPIKKEVVVALETELQNIENLLAKNIKIN